MMESDDLLVVLLCELGERIVAMRELLTEPPVAAKPHTRAVATLLARGLEAIEERLHRDVVTPWRGDGRIDAHGAVCAVVESAGALRLLHRRLGLLDRRWNVTPCDIYLRKLREDAGDVPHPAIVLADDEGAFAEDVAERVQADLHDVGVPIDTSRSGAEPIIALPRLEASNPLAWPLLLPSLVRPHSAAHHSPEASPSERARDEERGTAPDDAAVARLGGPAAFATRAVHALTTAAPGTPVWPTLAALATAARAYAGGLEDTRGSGGDALPTSISFFTRLARTRDRLLGHSSTESAPVGDASSEPELAEGGAPAPPILLLPTAAETAALLDKLVAGTPVNAIDAPLPDDFVRRLDAVRDAAVFYDLIGRLGERPASLIAILGVGWLYKIRYSYPLFRSLMERRETLGEAIADYRGHMIERNELLLQSIEAAYVQGIFAQGRQDG